MTKETKEQRQQRRDREYLKVGNGHVNLTEVAKMSKIGELKIDGITEDEKKQIWEAAGKLKVIDDKK